MRRAAIVLLAMFALAGAALPAGAATDPGRSRQWGLSIVGAPAAWGTATGRGVVIAVVDSGVDLSHEDLASKIVSGHDFVDGDATARDEQGHGTHVAGIAAAVTGNGRGVAGVAPDAKIMPLRVLDASGQGSESDVVDAIRWAVDHGADVVNLSLEEAGLSLLGSGSSGFEDAVDYAWNHGVVCVVAAGNAGLFSSGPGDLPGIVVSATDRNDESPSYSRGVDGARWGLAAPGGSGGTSASEDDILSTDWDPGERNQYAYRAGTSQATPHVSGAVALLLSRGLSPSQAVDRLLSTAKDLGPAGDDSTFGAGRLDVARAVGARASPSPSSSPSPKKTKAPPPPSPEESAPTPARASPSATPAAPSTPAAERASSGPSPAPAPSPAAASLEPAAAPSASVTALAAPRGDASNNAPLAVAWAIGGAAVAALLIRRLLRR